MKNNYRKKEDFAFTLVESVNDFLSIIDNSCCFIFISLFRRFTFCPSILSSVFGVRFRRTLSVVDNFFNVLLFATVVVEPNKRNGEDGMGLKSRISISGGLPMSCWERF
jgi:hypothetical protein